MAGARHGGAETFFVTLSLALQRRGLDQIAILRPHTWRESALADGGIAFSTLRFGGQLDLRSRGEIARRLASFQPDIVLAWMNRASQICPPGDYVKLARLGGYYNLKYYKDCDHLIGITPDIVEHTVRNGWPRERAHYLPNFCRIDEDADTEPRGPHDTPDSVPLALYIGRLHDAKGVDVLLHALSRLPGCHCWIAGDGPIRGQLEALSVELGLSRRVRFLGWRSDRTALMRAADVCVFPSRYEPFGSVTLEAWTHDLPLVAAASAGPAGVIRPDEDAVLVPIDDADALAAGMRRVLDSPDFAAQLVAAGAVRARDEFSEDAVSARYLELFEAVRPA